MRQLRRAVADASPADLDRAVASAREALALLANGLAERSHAAVAGPRPWWADGLHLAVVDDGRPARRRPAPPAGTRLPKIGAPATRALTAAGLTTLEAVAAVPEQELAAMHGVGPVALATLREALAEHGLHPRG